MPRKEGREADSATGRERENQDRKPVSGSSLLGKIAVSLKQLPDGRRAGVSQSSGNLW